MRLKHKKKLIIVINISVFFVLKPYFFGQINLCFNQLKNLKHRDINFPQNEKSFSGKNLNVCVLIIVKFLENYDCGKIISP